MITNIKIFEQKYYTPEEKRPINYKCLDIAIVLDELLNEKEQQFFWDWLDRYNNDDDLDVVFPDRESWEDSYEWEKKRFAKVGMTADRRKIISKQTVFKLPKTYDSSDDKKKYQSRIKKFLNTMKDMALKRGRSWTDKDEKQLLDNVNFGNNSFEKINLILTKIHDNYSQYYNNDSILCWYDREGYEGHDLSIFDYPVLDYEKKAIYLSELIDWINSFDMDGSELYEWILKNQYVEGRYWQRVWVYAFEDQTYKKNDASDNIKEINKLLKSLYKKDEINIFIDYYQKVDEKIF